MIRPGLVRSAKLDFLTGVHCMSDQYRLALYTDEASLGLTTKQYSSVGEADGQGYTPGGELLQGYTCGEDATGAYIGWINDVVWPVSSIEAQGALIYNVTKGGRALTVMRFPELVKSTVGPFTVWMSKLGGVVVRIP